MNFCLLYGQKRQLYKLCLFTFVNSLLYEITSKSVLGNIPLLHEKLFCCWVECYTFLLGLTCVFLLMFCLVVLSTAESVVLKSPTIVSPSIFSISFVNVSLINLGAQKLTAYIIIFLLNRSFSCYTFPNFGLLWQSCLRILFVQYAILAT